jgi:hypothetical protein
VVAVEYAGWNVDAAVVVAGGAGGGGDDGGADEVCWPWVSLWHLFHRSSRGRGGCVCGLFAAVGCARLRLLHLWLMLMEKAQQTVENKQTSKQTKRRRRKGEQNRSVMG